MTTVSVVIPTWNRSVLLEQAIRSALSQTFSPLEILVCDDGSTDNSQQVVSLINDPRVRWLTGERGGRPALPRNRGILESQGEWVAFLDDDDEWLPHKLEKQLQFAENLNCSAVCSNAFRIVSGKGCTGNYLDSFERITFDDLLAVNKVICSSSVIHRTLLLQVEGFPESEELIALEDYSLWLRIATLTDFAFVLEPLLYYRDDAVNSIRNRDMNTWKQRQAVYSDLERWGHCRLGFGSRVSIKRQRLIDLYHRMRDQFKNVDNK